MHYFNANNVTREDPPFLNSQEDSWSHLNKFESGRNNEERISFNNTMILIGKHIKIRNPGIDIQRNIKVANSIRFFSPFLLLGCNTGGLRR